MSRDRRIQFPGALYHVNSRGNDGRPIYLDEYDKEHFLATVADSVDEDQIIVHAYCLMGNHWHGLIETPLGNVADALHRINWTHACRFNRRHGFRDHVFGTTYHDELIHSDAHFLEVVRYIALNPCEAGVCRRPEDWSWSSYAGMLGLADLPPFVDAAEVLASFGSGDVGRARLRTFVEDGLARSAA